MILVTGASGRVGGQVLRPLVERDEPVRALVRRPEAVDGLVGAGADEVVVGDLADPGSVAGALDGVDAVFLLWPTGQDETAAEVVGLLAERADRVVYLSAAGADATVSDEELGPIMASHRRVERLLADAPVETTFVRGGGFAANTLGWAPGIRSEGVVREAFGGVPRALVHERDLAEVAVHALTTDDLVGAHPVVTGPAVVTGQEQVDAIAEAIGRDLQLVALSADEAVADLVDKRVDQDMARSLVAAWEQMAASPQPPTGDFERICGHAGTPFAVWAHDHVADFT